MRVSVNTFFFLQYDFLTVFSYSIRNHYELLFPVNFKCNSIVQHSLYHLHTIYRRRKKMFLESPSTFWSTIEMAISFRCEFSACRAKFFEDCDICHKCFCEYHVPCSRHKCGEPNVVKLPAIESLPFKKVFDTSSDNSFTASPLVLSFASASGTPLTSSFSSSSSSQIATTPTSAFRVAAIFEQGSQSVKRRRISSAAPLETVAVRVKWGVGEEKRCALSTDVESFKGSSWLWDHIMRFTKENSFLQQQNYEASCLKRRQKAIQLFGGLSSLTNQRPSWKDT